MKALLCKQHGLPDSLSFEEAADPVPGPTEVVVDMKAAGVNFPDVLIIQNLSAHRSRDSRQAIASSPRAAMARSPRRSRLPPTVS